jgi:mono/diheme cytochrome c family protein
MPTNRDLVAVAALLVFLAPAVQAQTGPSKQGKVGPTAASVNQHHSEGERIFQQNCSRCHNAPEGFSVRVSGTVVRHMRVRAQLSKHDEEELLRFFNP